MAQGTFTLYGNAKLQLEKSASPGIAWGTDTIVAVLVGTGYTPAATTDSTYANISANELTGQTGYTTGTGWTVTTSAPTQSGGTVSFGATNVSQTGTTIIAAKWVVLARRASTTLAAGDLLIGYFDLNTASGSSTVSTTNGTFAINWSGGNVFTLA